MAAAARTACGADADSEHHAVTEVLTMGRRTEENCFVDDALNICQR